jgi:hypothetical protein
MLVPWHRGLGCLGATPVAAADEYNRDSNDAQSVTMARSSWSSNCSLSLSLWGSASGPGGTPSRRSDYVVGSGGIKHNGFPWSPPGLLEILPEHSSYAKSGSVTRRIRIVQTVCFFVVCNRHWFNKVPGPVTNLGIACLPSALTLDAG